MNSDKVYLLLKFDELLLTNNSIVTLDSQHTRVKIQSLTESVAISSRKTIISRVCERPVT